MKEEMKIEELLNGFIDGELTARQETEARRLIDNDPQIAQRLQQLQKCRTLMSSLPVAEAPVQMLDNIKAALEAKTKQDIPELIFQEKPRKRSLLAQRIVAVAALIGLAAVLTIVMYTVAPPENTPVESDVTAVKDFHGKLELKTSDFVAVDAFINRAIEDKGLTGSLTSVREPNRRIYSVNCSEQDVNLLLADLRKIWSKLDTAIFYVETEVFGEQVAIEAVTTDQIGEIMGQSDSTKRIETAKDFALLNNIAASLPGKEIASTIEVSADDLIVIPKPVLTSNSKQSKTKEPVPHSENDKTIQLTIVINR
jgi:hypothetical protein